jgi:DNA-binding response OmpR family regulator
VIILSEACEDESFRAEIKRMFGASAYLPKPFDGETILAEIRRVLAPPWSPAGDQKKASSSTPLTLKMSLAALDNLLGQE